MLVGATYVGPDITINPGVSPGLIITRHDHKTKWNRKDEETISTWSSSFYVELSNLTVDLIQKLDDIHGLVFISTINDKQGKLQLSLFYVSMIN